MTLEEEAEEYVDSRGLELFKKYYYKQIPIADLLEKCCIEFAEQENNHLAQHIIELQKDKGELTDKVKALQADLKQAKEFIKNLMYTPRECISWYDLCNKAEQFLKED